MIIAPSNISRASSPSTYSRMSDPLPFGMASPTISDLHIERGTRTPRRQHTLMAPLAPAGYDDELVYREHVARLLSAKNAVFSVSGRIPLDPAQLVLFFRTKSGITHSLDFPIDVDYNSPPALDVLIASCRPHQTSDETYSDNESLFYPPNLPLTTSLEIANHPILDAVRSTLFPTLPEGHYLTAVRDRLEVVVAGGRMGPQSRTLRNDGRVATLSVTLPVRFRGGGMIIHSDAFDTDEKYYGRGGKTGDMEWTAFLADCDYEVETVDKGCKVSILYGLYLKTFGTGVVPTAEPLINPSDGMLDVLSPVLNMSRGRKLAFYLNHEYGVNPAEFLAEALVPRLKGGDSILYHALKLFKLSPELHWTAGGFLWAIDQTLETLSEDIPLPNNGNAYGTPVMRGAFNISPEMDQVGNLRHRIEASGALPLADMEMTILVDGTAPGKERVPFVSGPELEKLCVNTLIVVYVP